jgi:bifunctional DNase/RNase
MVYFFIIIILVFISIVFYSFYAYTQTQNFLTTEGFIRMNIEKIVNVGQLTVVQLKSSCSELSFYISLDQASAISEGMSNTTKSRPMTHDVFVDIIEGFDIKPILVKITKLSVNTYYAELILQRWNRFLIVDIRPSDALAIAVRTNTPIYVNEKLITKVC